MRRDREHLTACIGTKSQVADSLYRVGHCAFSTCARMPELGSQVARQPHQGRLRRGVVVVRDHGVVDEVAADVDHLAEPRSSGERGALHIGSLNAYEWLRVTTGYGHGSARAPGTQPEAVGRGAATPQTERPGTRDSQLGVARWNSVASATFSYLVPYLAASKEGSAACTMFTAPASVPFICCSRSSVDTVLMLAIELLGLNW